MHSETIQYRETDLPSEYQGYQSIGTDPITGVVKWISYGNDDDPFMQDDVFRYHEAVGKMAESLRDEPGKFIHWQREMCLNDIYYLGVYILGFTFMEEDSTGPIPIKRPWIFNRCREVQTNPDYNVDIWAREHLKSTIITLLKTIQDILNNPEIAVCIYSYNSSIAKSFVRQIRENLENPKLKELFPEIIPDNPQIGKYTEINQYGKKTTRKFSWSDENFTVKRKQNRKEPTVSGYGLVNSQPTGYHYDLLVYDDVVTPDSVQTPEQSRKTTERWKMSINTGAGESVRIRIIGTYYALRDTYFDILNPNYEGGVEGGSIYTLRKYPCLEGERPVLYTYGYIQRKRQQMAGFVFATQMLCNPQETSSFRFLREWLPQSIDQNYMLSNKDDFNFYIIVDPANTKSKDSDYTAMWTIATTRDKTYIGADLIYDKLLPTERRDTLFEQVKLWTNSRGKPVVFYESNSMSSDSAMIMEKQAELDYYFEMVAATTKPRLRLDTRASAGNLKFERIMMLEPVLRAHKVRFVSSAYHNNWEGRWTNMIDEWMRNEYDIFPFGKHDDGLDALSRIADLETGIMLTFPDSGNYQRIQRVRAIRRSADVYEIDKGLYQPW